MVSTSTRTERPSKAAWQEAQGDAGRGWGRVMGQEEGVNGARSV
jgi:hypothetical protein